MLTSTRKRLNVTPSEAVVKGISDEGGLFIIENAKEFKFGMNLIGLNYLGLAVEVLSFVFDDFKREDIERIVWNAYNPKNFDVPVAVEKKGDKYFLELWHGPTFAFKDMALTVLGQLMVKGKQNIGEKDDTLILTATSGDTGSATLSGFLNTGINCIILYPHGGVSPVQEAQMHYFAKNGSKAIAVEANFDYCQSLVKKVFTDKSVKLQNKKFSSANSINIGRLVPQIVYYMHTYLELVRRGDISFGQKVNFSVPTGNFGDILAGYIAYLMGVPVNKFICASNQNDVLTDFFNTGVYDRNREFYKTISPSMDILVSSNLERLLYLVSDGDEKLVSKLMDDLKNVGRYEIGDELKAKLNMFAAFSADDDETKNAICKEFMGYNYLMDPHTAVAFECANKYRAQSGDDTKTVIVSTANPYKFSEAVLDSLRVQKGKDIFDSIKQLEGATEKLAPKGIRDLHSFTFERTVWKKEDAEYNLRKLSGDLNV